MSEAQGPPGATVALCGIAGRFPGAFGVEDLWRNLCAGVESVRSFSPDELRAAGEDEKRLADPRYVPARGVLEGVDLFDAAFFGLSPREAEVLDPQHRLFLETAMEALEDAAYDSERLRGTASVFAGTSFSNYLVKNLYKNRPIMEAFGDFETTLHNVPDSLATLAGYKLDLKGPCCSVQTFCSTSLVAVHLACQSLLAYESDLALAGGVTLFLPQSTGYLFEEGTILSPDGQCRPFDARAGGTVFGNGVGVVVLRRLEDALRDGAPIRALVRGSAINNDGARKVSFAAPGVVGQTGVVVEALSASGVDPETIGFVEAHGTGTLLGDPAEVSALTKAYRTRSQKKGFCALGSVKANVGHLDAAAGVVGLIKATLTLEHGLIPPTLHYETPNPAIDFASSPFYVNRELREFPRAGAAPRRAAVSAFGVGGTNAHAILEEAPFRKGETSRRDRQLLLISARTRAALESAHSRLAVHLERHAGVALADVAFTLQVGRRHFEERSFLVAENLPAAASALRDPAQWTTASCETLDPAVAAEFDGRVAPSPALWSSTFATEPVFRGALADCLKAAEGGSAIEAAVRDGAGAWPKDAAEAGTFACLVAAARVVESWGVRFASFSGSGPAGLAADCVRGLVTPASALAQIPASAGVASASGADPQATTGNAGSTKAVASVRFGPDGVSCAGSVGLPFVQGRLWLAGVRLDWEAVHAPERRFRLHLPSYPFERKRFWVDPLPEEDASAPRDPARFLYRVFWRTAPPAAAPADLPASQWLVFTDEDGLGERLAARARRAGAVVLVVKPGPALAGDPSAGYALDFGKPEQVEALLEDLRRRGQPRTNRVVYVVGQSALPGDEPAHSRAEGGDGATRVTDTLVALGALVRGWGAGAGELHVVTSGLFDVLGTEPLAPERAPIAPFLRVLSQEEPDLECALVDLAVSPGGDGEGTEALFREIAAGVREAVVALRGGRRFTPDYEPVLGSEGDTLQGDKGPGPTPRDAAPSRVKDGGVYLITGGLGDVGFALGVSLAGKAKARLVLLGRRGLPPRAEWQDWLASHEPAETTALRMRKVLALESAGAEVLVVEGDVSRLADVRAAVAQARARFGRLDGVIHAAGEMDPAAFVPIRGLDRATIDRQLRPKAQGARNIAAALEGEGAGIDFVVLVSSLSSVLGGFGYAAYAGANAFLDAYAAQKARQGKPWLSLDFDQWRFAGRPQSAAAAEAARAGGVLAPDEGIAVFEHCLRTTGYERLVISTLPLRERLLRWAPPQAAPPAASAEGRERRTRRDSGVPFVPPSGPTQVALGLVWGELLGLDAVGSTDDFFRLGGHSLFAARVLSRVRDRFGVSLPLDAVFEAPTLAELAGRIDAALLARREEELESAGRERVEIEI